MNRSVRLANDHELPSMHAILSLCGEAMHRTQGLSHWYPYGTFEEFIQRVGDGKVYGVYDEEFLIGTFCLSENIPVYYPQIALGNPEAKALYFSKFGISIDKPHPLQACKIRANRHNPHPDNQ